MGSGFKDFAAGDILTAADVDGYLMRQTAMTFADASARDSALSGVLDEGMVAYLEDTNLYTFYDGSAWQNVTGLGGGSAVRAPGTFVGGDILQAAELNALPRGLVAESGTTTSVTWIGTNAATLVSLTATVVAGRRYMIHGQTNVQTSTSATSNLLYVAGTSIPLQSIWYQTAAIGSNLNKSMSGFAYYTATALSVSSGTASRTFDLIFLSGANGGTNFDPDSKAGSNTFPTRLILMDIGAE